MHKIQKPKKKKIFQSALLLLVHVQPPWELRGVLPGTPIPCILHTPSGRTTSRSYHQYGANKVGRGYCPPNTEAVLLCADNVPNRNLTDRQKPHNCLSMELFMGVHMFIDSNKQPEFFFLYIRFFFTVIFALYYTYDVYLQERREKDRLRKNSSDRGQHMQVAHREFVKHKKQNICIVFHSLACKLIFVLLSLSNCNIEF